MIVAASVEPFPGLRSFTTQESEVFFGRDEQVDELVSRLAGRRFLAVVGTSGSGKSSLVRAGLIPILQHGHLGPPGSEWVITTVLRPGLDPLHALARALVQAFRLKASELRAVETVLDKSSLGLSTLARQYLGGRQRLFILIDQFEELFRYRKQSGDEGRIKSTAFVKLLLAATGQSELVSPEGEPFVYIVLTMRSDYLGKCSQFRGLPEALNDSQYLVPRMSRDQLREAIEGPVAWAGARISGTLVDRLLNDAGDDPDLLPILQHVLFRIWEQAADARLKGELVDVQHYEDKSVRGIKQALDLDAETAFAKFQKDVAKQKIARRMFQRLVEPGAEDEESRRPTRLSEIVRVSRAPEAEVREVLDAFRKRGFLALSDEDDPLLDISHESLVRQWRRLQKWTSEEAQSASVYRRLADSALKKRSLYRGPDLAEALAWERNEAPNGDWAARYTTNSSVFSEAIQFLRRSELQRKLGWAGLALAMVVVFAIAVTFFVLNRNAQRNARESRVRELAAFSTESLSDDPEKSILLGMQAVNTTLLSGQPPLPAAEEALHQAILSSPVRMTLRGHSGFVNSVAFSPDGKHLATASDDQTAKVWDAESGKELLTLRGHSDVVNSVVFSPDGKRLATASDDQTAKVWDAESGKELLTLRGHSGLVIGVAFSPDGKHLATASEDHRAKVWDAESGKELLTLWLHFGRVNSVAFSPDGKRLATGSSDQTAKVCDAVSGKELLTLRGHQGRVNGVAFSPDGKRLATASDDQTAKMWDAASGKELLTLRGHSDAVDSLAFSPDGKRLITASWDQTAKVWDPASGKELLTLHGHSGIVNSVAFSPDGKRLATASSDQTTKVWDAEIGVEFVTVRGHSGDVNSVAFSPDGKHLATASSDQTAKVWDAESSKELLTLRGHSGRVNSVAFSPDGKHLGTASSDQTTKVWDAESGKELLTLRGHSGLVGSVAFSPDGKRLATASSDQTAKVWDAGSGKELLTLRGHSGIVLDVAFSPEGKRLATTGYDHTAKVWDAESGVELLTLRGHSNSVNGVAFSPDGKHLATASSDQTTKVWDAESGVELLTLRGHSGIVLDVALSPDGRRLANASGDRTVEVYALDVRELLNLARTRVTRTLTTEECQRYLQSKTCPPSP